MEMSCYMMAARGVLPVSEVLFLFFTVRGGSFLSPKEKEKNGGAMCFLQEIIGAGISNHFPSIFLYKYTAF